jgi:hypothetical protein
MSYYKGSVPTALQALFPEISIDKQKFWAQGLPPSFSLLFLSPLPLLSPLSILILPLLTHFLFLFLVSWKKRRKYFENYAKEHGFDPLVAENWYTQARSKILAAEVLSPLSLFPSSFSSLPPALYPSPSPPQLIFIYN